MKGKTEKKPTQQEKETDKFVFPVPMYTHDDCGNIKIDSGGGRSFIKMLYCVHKNRHLDNQTKQSENIKFW